MKLFQIEEPDGSPADPDAPGVAVGIDASGRQVEVAVAVGGNAVILADREGFEREIAVPPLAAAAPAAWQELFEGTRIRAERALARPVTHAVLGLAKTPGEAELATLKSAAREAGLELLLVMQWGTLDRAACGSPALVLATMAEDTAPPPRNF